MSLRTTAFLSSMASGMLSCCWAGAALAAKPAGLPDNYPDKSVIVVIASSPGGALDIAGRAIMTRLSERWNATFVAENRAGTNVAFNYVANQKPDGYTLMVSSNSSFFTADQVQKMPFDVRRKFQPIAQFISAPYIVAVTNVLPVRDMKALIAYGKEHPGKLNYGYSSVGSASNLAGHLLQLLGGFKMQGIGFKGVGPAYLSQMAGDTHITFGTAASAGPLVRSGKIRGIAVTSKKRAKALPDIPSVTETLPEWPNLDSWVGLLGIEGMSPAIVSALNKEVNQILALPPVEKLLESDGSQTTPGTPEDLRMAIAESLDTAKRIVEQAHIKLN